jgi:hypothetical protein
MRKRTAIALVAAFVLAVPAGAGAQMATDDRRVRQDAAALPERLWEPGPAPVSPAGPALPEEDGGVAPVLAIVLLLGAVAMGYATAQLPLLPSHERPAAGAR